MSVFNVEITDAKALEKALGLFKGGCMKEHWLVAVDKQVKIYDVVDIYFDDRASAELEAKRLNEIETNFNLVYEVWSEPV